MTLTKRLDVFMKVWLSNPAAQWDFVKLIADVHQQPRHDHADSQLMNWIDDQRAGLRSIGIGISRTPTEEP
jgi:hypothetical protein